MLVSGLRIGEVTALTWENVDLDKGLVRVNEFVTVVGGKVLPSEGKSAGSTRTVDIDPATVEILREHQRSQAAEQGESADQYVFCWPDGKPFHPTYLSRLAGDLTDKADVPRLTAHGFRHTSATLLLERGVHPKVGAERLGHEDTRLFMDLYSHVTPTMQKAAAEDVGEALFGDAEPGEDDE